jgi:hypothetical protein
LFRAVRELIEGVERPQRLERRTRAFARPGGLVTDRATERLLNAESERWPLASARCSTITISS